MFKINKDITMKLIFIISLFALASAFFIEYVLGHQPCNLCILERIPYLLAIIIVLLNYKFSQLEKNFILVITLIFLISTILSLYHLGIEQGFIEESLVCDLKNGSNLLSKEDILKQLKEKNVSCQDVTFKIFGLSLTSYNILISLLISIITAKIYFNYEKNRRKKS
jgi:disulfide bond formation protein DsbB|tara:strand:+ start:626 stop:1123 length:498 start_codon:yes stop_codon:yes gene_type:complete